MLLPTAVTEFESLFKSVTVSVKQQEDKDLLVTWSGGQRRASDTSAALYATQDLAIAAWLDTARSCVWPDQTIAMNPREPVLEWVLKPELHEFQITIADKRGMHRLVNNRFAVKSQFVVKTDG